MDYDRAFNCTIANDLLLLKAEVIQAQGYLVAIVRINKLTWQVAV